MKKLLILFFLLITGLASAQSWTPSKATGRYATVTNASTYLGKGAGTFEAPLQLDGNQTIDTAIWKPFIVGSEYRMLVNKVTYLGKAAGTVFATLVYNTNSITSSDLALKVSYSDSLTKFVTPAQLNTARVNDVKYLDSLTKYSTPASVNALVGDTANTARLNQDESVTGAWTYNGKVWKTTPLTITNDTIFATTGTVFTKTLSTNTTFKISSLADGQLITVAVTNTASNYTVAWSIIGGQTLYWSNSSTPVQTIGAHVDLYSFQRIGSDIYGSYIQNYK